MIDVQLIPILEDNYAYLIKTPCEKTAILDPGEADPIIKILENNNLNLDYIFITHHHWDHVNGVSKLNKKYKCKVVAPQAEANKIKGVDIGLNDGDIFELGSETTKIILTPGHTLGAICYYFKDSKALFTGDTLFSLGCGKLFEGTAKEMFESLEKIKTLPDDTSVYCGHEYTIENSEFCLAKTPTNKYLIDRIAEVKRLISSGKPSIPSTIGMEKNTNIFLNAKNAEEFRIIRQERDNV